MRILVVVVLVFVLSLGALAQAVAPAAHTLLVVLGTGTPVPNPERSGPSVAVVVNGSAYLVDFGPGVVRRAVAAFREKHIDALKVSNLKIAFATHLHSDHTAGLADLFLTPAVVGRGAPLELYGPPGLKDMARHIRAAYAKDIALRIHGLERGNPVAYKMNVHEIKPGVVYKDANVTVTAFSVPHGSWDYAYGYRFDTADRSIVISGDTGPNESVAQACHGCDLMLHEAYSTKWFERQPDQDYHSAFHTSATQVAGIAAKGKPKQLVLYHQLFLPSQNVDAELLEELRKAGYDGPAASAHDLDVY
ncbi:MAG: MBL fold metallo-hydrolase [Acidobacteriia bacterium]|nr:MBL fold metallo-hydrolase [Terriglobia bacterium]